MIAGLVLAAGAGRRFGAPKAEIVIGSSRLLDSAVAMLRQGGCGQVIAVVRADTVAVPSSRNVINPDPDRGMGSSLRLGVDAATDDPAIEACVITLVDLIGVTSLDVEAVIAEFRAGHQIVAARRAGHRSHPVLVGRGRFAEFVASTSGDAGARAFLDGRQAEVRFVDLAGQVDDIDTPEDLERLS